MYVTNATNARASLYKLIDMAIDGSEIINITSKHGNAVMMSEDDYNALIATLSLSKVPGLVDSVRESAKAPLSEFVDADSLEW